RAARTAGVAASPDRARQLPAQRAPLLHPAAICGRPAEGSRRAEREQDRGRISLRAAAFVAGGQALWTCARRASADHFAIGASGQIADVVRPERSPAAA